jgi:O-antigen/teichoic acid export membrane protein
LNSIRVSLGKVFKLERDFLMDYISILKPIRGKYILSKVIVVTFFDLISKVLSAITAVMLIRLMTIKDYGYLTFFNSISAFISGVITSGLTTSYIRYESEHYSRDQGKSSGLYRFNFNIITVIHGFVFIFCYIFSKQLGLLLFASPVNSGCFSWGVLFAYTMAIQRLNESYYQSKEEFKKAGIILNIKNMVVLACLVLLFSLKMFNLLYVLAIYVGISLVISIVNAVPILTETNSAHCSRPVIYEFLSASGWLLVYCLFLNMFNQLDVLMISRFLGDKALAEFGVAIKYYALLLTLLPSIMAVLRVRTSKSDMVDDLQKQRRFTVQWIKKSAPISFVLSSISALAAMWIFPIVNGTQYNASILTFQILCFGVMISYICAPNVSVLMSMKKYKFLSILSILAFLINLVGNYLFIPKFGINAAACCTILSNAIINVCSTIIVLRNSR